MGVATAEDAEHERILGPGVAEAAHRRHRDGVPRLQDHIVLTVVPPEDAPPPAVRAMKISSVVWAWSGAPRPGLAMMTVTQNFSPWGILARNSRVDRRGEPDVRVQGPLVAGQLGLVERRLDRRGLAEADVALLDLSVVLGTLLPRHPPDFFGAHDRADRQGRGGRGGGSHDTIAVESNAWQHPTVVRRI